MLSVIFSVTLKQIYRTSILIKVLNVVFSQNSNNALRAVTDHDI